MVYSSPSKIPDLEFSETCGIFIDLLESDPAPEPGTFVVSVKAKGVHTGHWFPARVGSVYIIKTARLVRRRDPHARPRYQLRCFRGTVEDLAGAIADQIRVIRITWYRRGKKLCI